MERDLYDKIIQKLDDLIDNTNLNQDRKILFSEKVLRLEEYIKPNNHGQCIIFVERVYTAAFLCQVLRKIFENSIQIKYLAGSKTYIDGISVSAKYQVRNYLVWFRSFLNNCSVK
jgi:superfamily II DNA/RNA helicase